MTAQETEKGTGRTPGKEKRHNKSAAFFNPFDLLHSVCRGGLGGCVQRYIPAGNIIDIYRGRDSCRSSFLLLESKSGKFAEN